MWSSIQQWNLLWLLPLGHDGRRIWIPAWENTGSFQSERRDAQGSKPDFLVHAEQSSGTGGGIDGGAVWN